MAVELLYIPDWAITKSEDTSIGSRVLNMCVCAFAYIYYYLKLLDSANLSLVTMTQCYTISDSAGIPLVLHCIRSYLFGTKLLKSNNSTSSLLKLRWLRKFSTLSVWMIG